MAKISLRDHLLGTTRLVSELNEVKAITCFDRPLYIADAHAFYYFSKQCGQLLCLAPAEFRPANFKHGSLSRGGSDLSEDFALPHPCDEIGGIA